MSKEHLKLRPVWLSAYYYFNNSHLLVIAELG